MLSQPIPVSKKIKKLLKLPEKISVEIIESIIYSIIVESFDGSLFYNFLDIMSTAS